MPKRTSAAAARASPVYQRLAVPDPTAGVDLRTTQTLLPPEKARTLVNWSLTEPGTLGVRPGYTLFSTSSLGASAIQGAARVYINTSLPTANSTAFTLVGWNSGLYVQNDNGTWNSTTAQLTGLSTRQLSFVSDRDLAAVLDGSTTPWLSTNGTAWRKLGLQPSTAAPTLSSLSTGGLSSGDYEIGFTYKDRDLAHESNGSTAVSTITLGASSGAINVVVPNSTETRVDAVVIYARKVSAGETVRRKISSQVASTGANSTVIVTSTSWTANAEEPTDHTVPPALSFGVVWKNRWWARHATITNRLHFTQLFQPQSWPGLFYLDIPFERGDAIQALQVMGDTLLLFGTNKVFIILGQTSLDFEVRPSLGSQDGALGFRATTQIENGVVHAGPSGIYLFDGLTDRQLNFDLEPAWKDLVENTAFSELAKTSLVYHKKAKEIRVSVARRFPAGVAGEWVLDLNRTRLADGQVAWTATDRVINGYLLWDGAEAAAGNIGRLFSWNSTTGQLFEEATGTSGNSSNLTAEYEGAGLTLGEFRARWIDIRGEYQPQAGTFSLEPVIDGVSQGTFAIAIGAGLSAYGTGTYGTATYAGAGRRQFHTYLPLAAEGRTLVLKATYAGQQTFRWFGYRLGLVPESQSRDFSE